MRIEPITYSQLHEILSQLGFSCQRVEPKWIRYEHAPSDTVIVLVEKKPKDRVRVTDAVSARKHLVEKGLISEEEIESLWTPIAVAKKS